MGRQKAAKLATKQDQLSELPDGILSTIISMLTLKEAVKMCVLSKRWRFIWASHVDLLFDSATVLSSIAHDFNISNRHSKGYREEQRRDFIDRVNQVMHQRCNGTKVDSLVVHFHLGKISAPHIDQWISSATTKGVENIDIDLSESCSFMPDPDFSSEIENYVFPCWLLTAAGKKCRVKYLRLASCCLSAPSGSNRLTSLTTLQLQGVQICDQRLESFLSSCLFLEGLSLHRCDDLISLKIAGPSPRLKFLSVQHCCRLQKLELCAKNLVSFEYSGHFISFYFKNVPSLAEAFLSFTGESRLDGATYALARFATDLPQLETLYFVSVLAMKIVKLPQTVRTFTNIKQLVLTVYPFDDEDTLSWIVYVLEAYPSLHKLQLNLFSANFIRLVKTPEIERVLPERHHLHLRELEVTGFNGYPREKELLKYLLANLFELKVLAVSHCPKVYGGLHDWSAQEATSSNRFARESVYEWLHDVVPQTVLLQI